LVCLPYHYPESISTNISIQKQLTAHHAILLLS